jgi:hypothetical protein
VVVPGHERKMVVHQLAARRGPQHGGIVAGVHHSARRRNSCRGQTAQQLELPQLTQ